MLCVVDVDAWEHGCSTYQLFFQRNLIPNFVELIKFPECILWVLCERLCMPYSVWHIILHVWVWFSYGNAYYDLWSHCWWKLNTGGFWSKTTQCNGIILNHILEKQLSGTSCGFFCLLLPSSSLTSFFSYIRSFLTIYHHSIIKATKLHFFGYPSYSFQIPTCTHQAH